MKREIRRGDLAPPHLDDTEIVSYLDGELLRDEMENARTHLESCWTCRSRVAAVQSSIGSFVRLRLDFLPDLHAGSEQRTEQFRQRLMRHASANEGAPSFPAGMFTHMRVRIRSFTGSLLAHRTPVIAVLVVVCLLLAIFTDTLTTKVSAETVLLRVQKYESAHGSRPGQVLRSSVRVARVDRRTGQERNLGSVTVLRDSLTPATYVTAELPSGHVAHSLLTNANQDGSVLSTALDGDFPQAFMTYLQDVHWMPEISVAEFRKLISDRESRESSAKRIGSELELRYPFGAGHRSGIAEARLTISAEDYSPLQLILVPADRTDEFRFVRTSYSPEPRTEEIARLFPPIDNQPQPSVTTLPKLAKAVPLSYHNSQAGESELAAASALHTLDACLGEELNIFPMSNGTVLVQGLVETSARRNAIRKALSAINLPLRVEIFLPQELKNGAELLSPPDRLAAAVPGQRGTMAATVADLSAQRIPLYEQLSRHFSEAGSNPHDTEQQIADFSNQVVTQARQTFLHAWALKKLDSEFSAERVIRLSPAAIAQVEGMRRDHRRWIAELSRREREMLEGVGSYVAEPMQLPTSAEQPSTVLLRLAREQDDLVRSLFTHSQYAQDPEAGLARLRSLLRQIGG